MSAEDNTQVAQQAYNYFKQGNIQDLLGLCADNIEWESPEVDNVPFSGKRQGRDQVAQFFSMLADAQEALEFTPQEFIAQGDKVVALGHYVWSIKSTDRNFEGDWAHVFTVSNGQIVRFREYIDTAAAAAAYQPR